MYIYTQNLLFQKRVFSLFAKLLLLISTLSNLNSETLKLSINSNPARINPILATDSASSEVANWIFEGLFKYDKDANIIPNLAKEFYFEDNRTLIIELKENVTWSDGVKFSAKDVIFTYEIAISDKVFTPYSSSFKYVESIEALDRFKLKISYSKPYFKALEIWLIGILPEHILKSEKNLMTSKFNSNPVGVGSYKLKEFKASQDIELVANENYHLHKPYIDRVLYKFLPDSNSAFLMLKSQKLDMGSLTPLQIDRQLDSNFHKNFQIIEQMGRSYTYLGFNLKSEKFKDIRVRKAIDLAIDKEELIDILFFGHGRVCNSPFLPKDGNSSNSTQSFNPKRAIEILNSLGFTKESPFEFEIVTNSNNPIRLYALEIIQHQLQKVGVKVKIRSIEWQAFLNRVVHPRDFEAILLGWSLPVTPNAYNLWHSESDFVGGFNFIGYSNSKVDKLIKEAETIIDSETRAKVYKEIERLIIADYPYVFLYIPNSITAINRKISPVEPSIIGLMHNQIEWKFQP